MPQEVNFEQLLHRLNTYGLENVHNMSIQEVGEYVASICKAKDWECQQKLKQVLKGAIPALEPTVGLKSIIQTLESIVNSIEDVALNLNPTERAELQRIPSSRINPKLFRALDELQCVHGWLRRAVELQEKNKQGE